LWTLAKDGCSLKLLAVNALLGKFQRKDQTDTRPVNTHKF
jgi:hypothetical protein